MKKHIIILFLLTLCVCATAQTLIWDVNSIDANCIKRADNICKTTPVAVTDKVNTRSGNKHNFEALSIYMWPDPANPNGPYIAKDGQANPEYKQYDLPRLAILRSNTLFLSQAFYLTHDQKYYDAYCKQIDTWFLNKNTRMTPHFEYNQFIPGRNNGKGCSAGVIDAYNFIDVIESLRLVDAVQPIGKKRMKGMKNWCKKFSKWMQTSDIGKGASITQNNHSSAYDVTLFYLSQFTGDNMLCQKITSEYASKRINKQINEDGAQPEELKRTRAFFYSVFNIRHMVDFCIMQNNLGNDYINTDGKRIKDAILFLKQYIGKKDDFPYQEIGDWNSVEIELQDIINKVGL